MGQNIYTLFWGGIFFLAIGLWMWKKDRNQIQLMDDRMTEKENNLYELYQALEEIMNEMHYIYQDKVKQDTMRTHIEEGETTVILQEEQGQYIEENIEEHDKYIEEITPLNGDEKQDEKLPVTKYHRVIELKDQGYTEEEIARELKIGKGEVRLIIGFNR